jgi:predicted component of type VI protein secretion system
MRGIFFINKSTGQEAKETIKSNLQELLNNNEFSSKDDTLTFFEKYPPIQ